MKTKKHETISDIINDPDILNYDYYIISFSGGKDSTACFLYLLDLGIPLHKIELWHQEIDGRERAFMDWEVTPAYCKAFADAFGVKIYFQWKEGGFRRELTKTNDRTAPSWFELPDGSLKCAGGIKGEIGTRLKFPQLSHDLKIRWCSSYLKIDVFAIALRNQERFRGKRTLVLTGERGEESPQRAKYKIFEPHAADRRKSKKLRRHIDHFRPIRDWKEKQVWEIIERYRVRVHPCYYMGWHRCSCKFCIFGDEHQFASAGHISPIEYTEVVDYERCFKCSIKRNMYLPELVRKGQVYSEITDKLAMLAIGNIYTEDIIIPESDRWILPAGAYKDKKVKKKSSKKELVYDY